MKISEQVAFVTGANRGLDLCQESRHRNFYAVPNRKIRSNSDGVWYPIEE